MTSLSISSAFCGLPLRSLKSRASFAAVALSALARRRDVAPAAHAQANLVPFLAANGYSTDLYAGFTPVTYTAHNSHNRPAATFPFFVFQQADTVNSSQAVSL